MSRKRTKKKKKKGKKERRETLNDNGSYGGEAWCVRRMERGGGKEFK